MARKKKVQHNKFEVRYRLQPFNSRGKTRYQCPSCGKKDVFAKYVDITTGEYLGDDFGRCNREVKCGYHKPPTADNLKGVELYVPQSKVMQQFIEADYTSLIQPKYLIESLNGDNNFINFLLSKFPRESVENVSKRYRIGNSNVWRGSTIFWQIDQDFDLRTGKIMLYNKETGKRVKEPYNHISWAHKPDKNLKYGVANDFALTQCFFGEHLLKEYSHITEFRVVESEKTAILCTLMRPNTLWIATGGLQNINETRLLPFKGKKLIFYPDKGKAYNEWEKKLKPFMSTYDITIDKSLENNSKLNEGDDMGDLVLLNLK